MFYAEQYGLESRSLLKRHCKNSKIMYLRMKSGTLCSCVVFFEVRTEF
jgi:hypothetical protein